eukprot:Nitzschia sp. Nitz4//scaffold146_size56529//29606//31567//NITZ4_006577-RA/size56529-processed-gene-0.32-mRNA-1//1//CDS//3329536638//2740//frame0
MTPVPSKSLGDRLEAPLAGDAPTHWTQELQQPRQPRPDDDLPSDIQYPEQLSLVPKECLSGDPERPLLHVDERGKSNKYALQPMTYSVFFILLVEFLERFSFYGYYNTMTLFLTGAYNDDWNAGFPSVEAATLVAMSTSVAYSAPFLGAFLGDSVWGDYKSILFGLTCFYIPGVSLITLTSIPNFLGDEFNQSLLLFALLVLWPLGTGIVKSIVNVFGAKQFHPLLQSSIIESYYVKFYMSINTGALLGIGTVPILAQHWVSLAYALPLGLLTMGALIFLTGTPRYVQSVPRRQKRKQVGKSNAIPLSTIFSINILIIPFCVGYSQMPTTFVVQGTVMTKAFGMFDVASMNSLDSLSVLFFGWFTASVLYPALGKRGIKLATTTKFAIGSLLGALAICWALVVEYMIHAAYHDGGRQICVLWQAPAYILIGWGEIFSVSAAYEMAFTASSPDTKALASATNIFCVGGLPNIVCIFLFRACQAWFENSSGTTEISHIEDYATAHVRKYFFLLLGMMGFGVIVNSLPSVRNYVSGVEERAAELVKTPVIRRDKVQRKLDNDEPDESSPMLTPGARRYQEYLKHGEGPVLYKMGSMRAGPTLSQSDLPGSKPKAIKYKYVQKLYNSEKTLLTPNIPHGADRKLLRKPESYHAGEQS